MFLACLFVDKEVPGEALYSEGEQMLKQEVKDYKG